MSESTPDLSKIIGVIMENPDIIKRISELAGMNEKPPENAVLKEAEQIKEPLVEPTVSTAVSSSFKRKQLLGALKPYMSDDRSRAMESMMAIAEILDMMKAR